MTKSELIQEISKDVSITKKAAEATLVSFFKSIKNSLKKGIEVRLVGFGTFKVSKRAARTGRNPRTGVAIKIAASKVPTFKAGKDLKTAVK